ncbi:MAG: hypothetical protein Kow0081_3720 [Candidatus Dojkabacteria bacterium]
MIISEKLRTKGNISPALTEVEGRLAFTSTGHAEFTAQFEPWIYPVGHDEFVVRKLSQVFPSKRDAVHLEQMISFVAVSIMQVELHPSPLIVFPSSHFSPVSIVPFPHTAPWPPQNWFTNPEI